LRLCGEKKINQMTKPKVYVSRILAEEGLQELREVCDLQIWQEKEKMPRDVQFQLLAVPPTPGA
jgi:hypothetical protein